MNTTLNEILKHGPCGIRSGGASGFSKLLKNLNKTKADDEPLHIMDILKSNGIKNAIWALRCFDYLDYCLFLADVAELVLVEFESQFPDDDRPRKAIQAIRDYKSGLISREQLIDAATAARASAARASASANAGYDSTAYAAAYVAYAAAYVAYAAGYAAGYADDAADTHAAIAHAIGSWTKIEELFIKHFGGQNEHSNSTQ